MELELLALSGFSSAYTNNTWKHASFKDHPKFLGSLSAYLSHSDLELWESIIKALYFSLDVSKFQTFQPILSVSKCDIILCIE